MNITDRMEWDEFFMRQAYLVSYKSRDPRTKIGSVLVKDNRMCAGAGATEIHLAHLI